MRKPELAAAIAAKSNLSKEKASQVLTAITDEIAKAMARQDEVSLIGFGTFSVRKRSERNGKNPQTGAAIKIPATLTVGFKPGKSLKDAVQANQ